MRGAADSHQIYGSSSVLNPDLTLGADTAIHITGLDPFYVPLLCVEFALLISFYILIYRYWWQLEVFVKSALSLFKSLLLIENRSVDVDSFMTYSTLLLYASIWITAFYAISQFNIGIIDYSPWLLLLILLAPLCFLWLYRRLAHWICGVMGNNKEFYHQLRFFNKILFAFMSLIYIPVLLVVMFAGLNVYYLIALLAVLAVFYLERIYKYFNHRGFALLQWILYLCTVEILPVSFMVGLMLNF